MNDTQKSIKTTIEDTTKQQYGIDVVVEYVLDVSERTHEIQQECGEKLNSVYEAECITGTFIPSVNNKPYYILIQENRETQLDVMTAFHEYRHLLDYVLFLRIVASNNIETLKKSPLYVTFNVYSEYAATLFGVTKYIECIKIEDMSQTELAGEILQNAKLAYQNLEGIENRYQLLVHSMQYIGYIIACSQFSDEIDTKSLISEMKLSEELYSILGHIFMYEDKYKWYENLDKMMRDFVDGGVER